MLSPHLCNFHRLRLAGAGQCKYHGVGRVARGRLDPDIDPPEGSVVVAIFHDCRDCTLPRQRPSRSGSAGHVDGWPGSCFIHCNFPFVGCFGVEVRGIEPRSPDVPRAAFVRVDTNSPPCKFSTPTKRAGEFHPDPPRWGALRHPPDGVGDVVGASSGSLCVETYSTSASSRGGWWATFRGVRYGPGYRDRLPHVPQFSESCSRIYNIYLCPIIRSKIYNSIIYPGIYKAGNNVLSKFTSILKSEACKFTNSMGVNLQAQIYKFLGHCKFTNGSGKKKGDRRSAARWGLTPTGDRWNGRESNPHEEGSLVLPVAPTPSRCNVRGG